MTPTTRHLLQRNKERGSILGLAAVGMTAILLAVGLCVDVGHWYLVAGELQNAADAAALAATSSLDATAGGIIQAVDRAVATVNKYEFNGTNATITRSDVRFAAQLTDFDTGTGMSEAAAQGVAPTIRFVKVTVPPKSVSVFFASLATNSSTVNFSRSAVAGLSVGLNKFGNIVPIAVVENLPGQANPRYLPSSNCGSTGLQFIKGCQYSLTVSTGNAAPVGGEYVILNLNSERNNSNDLRGLLGIGSDGYVISGQPIPVLPGDKIGQTLQGLRVRFDDYQSGIDPATFPPDANIREGITRAQYRDPAFFTAPTHTGVWDRRLIVVPIITPDQYDDAAKIITPTKFGAFFMNSSLGNGQNSPLYLEYIGLPAVIGNGGYDPNGGPATADVTTAVLYR